MSEETKKTAPAVETEQQPAAAPECSQLAGTQYCRSASFYYFRKYSPSYRCNI